MLDMLLQGGLKMEEENSRNKIQVLILVADIWHCYSSSASSV